MQEPVPYPLGKQVLDRTVSAALLVAAAPLFAGACVVMGADMALCRGDRGPWLYRERRISRGREFDLLKFRTLRRDVLEAEGGVAGHARLFEADPKNLTWAARRVLKRWYLDELPQLFNVLRGDLSLVGPRPWPLQMVAQQVADGIDYRLRIMAGWTGPAQVKKGITEPEGYTALDLGYVEACHTSSARQLLRHDLGILLETVKVVARGEGLEF